MDFTFKPRKATTTFVVNKNNYKWIKSIFPDNQVVFGTTRFSQYEFQNGIACDTFSRFQNHFFRYHRRAGW